MNHNVVFNMCQHVVIDEESIPAYNLVKRFIVNMVAITNLDKNVKMERKVHEDELTRESIIVKAVFSP